MIDKYSLKIDDIRARSYPGGELRLEKQLEDGQNYHKFIVSYPSDGLKIFALLTIPVFASGQAKQSQGFPLVVFNRGFVDPADYATDRQYMRYIDLLSKAGFAVFKSDYRGIGDSEGEIASVVDSSNATDVLNGLASLKRHSELVSGSIDFTRIFLFGHSMGGMITLQCMLANNSFKAASIWAGFIIPYADILTRWQESPLERQKARAKALLEQFGPPSQNEKLWRTIAPFYYLNELPGPIQLHHGQKDPLVPVSDSQRFHAELQKYQKDGGLYLYENAGHNLNEDNVLPEAMKNTIEFFRKELK